MLSYKAVTRSFLTLIGLVAVSLAVVACGYRPLYGQYSLTPQVEHHLAAIKVATIPNRVGQQMHTALMRRLAPKRTQIHRNYKLLVSLTESTRKLAIERNALATRTNFTLTANFILMRLSDNTELTYGRAKSVSSYNILSSDFATLAAQSDARERAVEDLAETLRTRMAIYFLGPGAKPPTKKTGTGYR